ncbi:MAG: D-alanyl-D-alanine carboxypeptidase [Thermoleophilia bacterium]|nr:D-alanyl-D-alanine carboxypeptidase [Thermoleophilia bacterium]
MTRTGGSRVAPAGAAAPATATASGAPGDHTIQRGDTLSALARRFGTTVDALAAANGIANPDLIIAGATLHLVGAASTTPPAAPASGGVGRVVGRTTGLRPDLAGSLDALSRELGVTISVISGNRTLKEQALLYEKYRKGTGNLAAKPGTSNHERGQAADAYVDAVPLAKVPGAAAAAARLGLHFPVNGEAWHVEHV